jgi:hypothetical protein
VIAELQCVRAGFDVLGALAIVDLADGAPVDMILN